MTRTYMALLSLAWILGGFSVATADGFTTVLNVPPDTLDSLPFHISAGPSFHFVPSGTQVNLTGLSSSEISFLEVREGGELNYFAEGVNSTAQGGVINLFDGGEVDVIGVVSGGHANILNGRIKNQLVIQDAEAMIAGGSISSLYVEGEGGSVLIQGGEVQNILWIGSSTSIPVEAEVSVTGGDIMSNEFSLLVVSDKSVLNISGGIFHFENLERGVFSAGSQVNFFGYDFAIDGVPIPGLASDVPFEVFDRDVVLSGRLSDGSPFSLPLGSESLPVLAAPGSHVTVTYAIPEPGAFLLALLGVAGMASGRVGIRG